MSTKPKADPAPKRAANQRGAARLGAVQALYQMDVGRTTLEDTVAEFVAHRLGREVAGDEYLPADADYFQQILRGVAKHQLEIDPLIDRSLIGKWPVGRLDATLRAILRAGVFELLKKRDLPAVVVISEYVDIAKAFFDDDAPGLVNGVLDAIAREEAQNRAEVPAKAK